MPPVTPSHIYALSKVLPFAKTPLRPRYPDLDDSEDEGSSIIKSDDFLDGLALLLVQKPTDDAVAISIVRDPPRTRFYYTKSRLPFDDSEKAGLEKIKALLLDARIGHATGFLSLSVELCFERIISRVVELKNVGELLGLTPDASDGEFTMICVPDEETVWKYITSKYGAKELEKSNLRRVVQLLFLSSPGRETQRDIITEYLRMAMILSEVLAKGLELWSTGAIAGLPLSNDSNGDMCGVFLAKKEFGMCGAELEKVYEESEILMGKIVDAIGGVGVYAKAARDIAVFLREDVELRRSILERKVLFYEVKPTIPVMVEITGKPVDLINKFLRKSGRAAMTDTRITKTFPNWPESRLKDSSQTVSCYVHCELTLIWHTIRTEHSLHKVDKVNLRYGCSHGNCYLCEVYIQGLRNHLVGAELGKFLTAEKRVETRQQEQEHLDDLSTIVSHLKGLTAQPGKALRGWFSGVTQQDPGGKPSIDSPSRDSPSSREQKEQIPKHVPLAQKLPLEQERKGEEKLENPGYSRGYRRIFAEWQFPKDTPAEVKKEVEKNIEGKLRDIYTATRASNRKSEDLKKPEGLPPTILEARSQ
ncbi:hypothetical protein TWF718_001928 [Orbilia javanica]|uniref:Uncharacterized protein n=1 Tax=Orbilia javanica TaxID=47235 RepID=A0AAN8NAH4_9PEZI